MFTILTWPLQTLHLSPKEKLWVFLEREIYVMDVQATNLQQQCDAIIYQQPVPSKVASQFY